MKLLFKYATRGRPEWFLSTLGRYYDYMSGKYPFEFVVTADKDDPSMNNEELREQLAIYRHLSLNYGYHKNKIEAMNAHMEGREFDICVVVSDDMVPQVQDYDSIIVADMKEHFPDTDGALHYHDGLFGKDKCITFSVLGKKLYDRFGYIYHPDYRSFYCDNEFTEVVYGDGKCVYCPSRVIKHTWTGGGQSSDETYRLSTERGKQDEATYKKRKAAGFPKESVL